ncbi:MAG: hypothetical protein ABDH28_07475 [Brevinematia bacterium]
MNDLEYPVYVISKGRYRYTRNRMTWSFLKEEGIPFYLVVEPSEAGRYKEIHDNLLVLPEDNYGFSTPARNFAWEHSIKMGYKAHFILDDNINRVSVVAKGKRKMVRISYLLEASLYVSKMYEKWGMIGFREEQFMIEPQRRPITFNTHIYSFMLINNNLPFRWKLKYNEDVDMNLKTIGNGFYTIQILVFTFHKYQTRLLKGGNTSTLYTQINSKVLKTNTLVAQYPHIVRGKNKFGRFHHEIDWKKFYSKPIKSDKYEEFREKLVKLYKDAIREAGYVF